MNVASNGQGRRRAVVVGLAAMTTCVLVLTLTSCSTVVDRRDPTGELFPGVEGESLSGERVRFPDAFLGAPVVVLIGYRQDSQFDIDRWLLGATQAGLEVRLVEVPTIPGLVPRMASGFIDRGMRSGIPSEDWGSVVCVYGDAAAIVAFTGNENPLPGRVVLLDAEGRVVFFHDRGYSVGSLVRLEEELRLISSP